jgi:hypothetical protein
MGLVVLVSWSVLAVVFRPWWSLAGIVSGIRATCKGSLHLVECFG